MDLFQRADRIGRDAEHLSKPFLHAASLDGIHAGEGVVHAGHGPEEGGLYEYAAAASSDPEDPLGRVQDTRDSLPPAAPFYR